MESQDLQTVYFMILAPALDNSCVEVDYEGGTILRS